MRSTSLVPRACRALTVACLALAATTVFAQPRHLRVEPAGEHEALKATTYASTGSCGVERWSVKVGTDPDAGLVNLNATTTQTISYLGGIPAPASPPLNSRVQPTEITNFVVDATLIEFKLENDSDYHLVIKDAAGNTMIAEIPDPACVASSSPFASLITAARQAFDSKYTATTSFQTVNTPVRLTGVGFFDFLHGQTGVAPNGIELHPLLKVVFNPSTGGGADFTLAASPTSVSVSQGASTSTTITVVPTNGFNSSVTFAAAGLPAGVTAVFNPVTTTGSTTLTLTASASAATGPATISIAGSTGSLTHTSSVNLTVNAAGGGSTMAVYNATLKAPGCASVGASCDSGTLLLGRGTMTGGAEPNQPNTINTSCTDGASGTFHSDESNDRIVVASTDGSPLTAGKTARITATVWVYSTTTDALDLYSAANANAPTWTFLNTITPAATGAQTLTTTFVVPTGGLQAVRAHFRYNGTAASACSTGAYDESDDLIFAVSSTAPAPDFSVSTSPSALTVTQGASGTSTVSVGSLNGFSSVTSLSISGLPSGVTAAFSPNPVTPVSGGAATSTLTLTAASTAPTGAATVTITGVSGSLNHSATLSLSVTASGGGATQLLGNTGFETGTAAPWTTTTGVVSNSTSEPPHAGSWDVWMNGYGSAHTDTVSQQVAIPAGKTSASLTFYMHIDTAETSTTTAYDTLKVQVYNTSGTLLGTLYTYSNLNKNTGYSVHNLTMTPYVGQTVVIKFAGTEDASSQTSFVIDDVTLNVQ